MSNNLCYYKDNILSKIKKNEEIDKVLTYIHLYLNNKDKIKVKIDKFSPKIEIEKQLLVDILKQLKESNDKHIDRYLGLSFDSENYYKKIWRENQNENSGNSGKS